MKIMQEHRTEINLKARQSGGGEVAPIEGGWKLRVPEGPAGAYRWAQIDDYLEIKRPKFLWRAPFRLRLEARASAQAIPGTWGFGFWNDPLNFSFNLGGAVRRLPALPNSAWFFFAAPPNHLALRDHPGDGMLAAAFSSPRIPSPVLGLGLPMLPFLFWRPTARLLLRAARVLVRDSAVRLEADWTAWHAFELDCQPTSTRFFLDGMPVFETTVVPSGPQGLVIWIDNQFAAIHSDGRLGYGTLPSRATGWLEVKGISVEMPPRIKMGG
jgi:hypothetical protein